MKGVASVAFDRRDDLDIGFYEPEHLRFRAKLLIFRANAFSCVSATDSLALHAAAFQRAGQGQAADHAASIASRPATSASLPWKYQPVASRLARRRRSASGSSSAR